ncbi:hypothetical protein H8D04_00670 [bacterium]|nr:hypothetical protein [bacterium]
MARKKPIPRNQRATLNRARQYKRDVDEIKDVSISLMDLDSAIMCYFTEVIKPTVMDNGEQVKVPIMYASPERWFAIQKTGYMRDKKRQLILPVIAFRRTGMSKDETIPLDTMDPEEPKLHWQFERKYTDANRYDNFSVQQGLIPQREYYNVAVPDFMVLNYDFIIWTSYIEQMNKLVERINWSEGAYWGEPGKMKFRTSIDSFTDSTEVSDRERIVKTEFSVTLKGYLIPEAFNELAGPHTMQKYITPKTLSIGAETDVAFTSIVKQDEGVQEVRISGGGSPGVRRTTTDNPLIIESGTGVTVSNSGNEWDGFNRLTQNIAIGQAVATSSNVSFNSITSSTAIQVGASSISATGFTGDWDVSGALTTSGNLTVVGNATIQGDLTAQSFNSELVNSTVLYDSGSTKFGDDVNDNHEMTGSLLLSGSLNVNSYNITEISNNTSLGTGTAVLPTQNAVKTYVDDQVTGGISTVDTYLRKTFVKKNSSIIGTSTASFNAITASAPAGMTLTSEDDFVLFINGQYMEHDALTIQQAGSSFYLKVDTDSIGYVLESDDEIIAMGKFNA